MGNHDSRIAHSPEASTYERASSANHGPDFDPGPPDDTGHPTFACQEAEQLYWRAYRAGIRAAGREPGHPHMPADFSLDLTRDGVSAGLVSDKLLEAWPERPHDPPERTPRADGWSTEREQVFIRELSTTGVVADACRAIGISRTAAYAHRGRARSRAFKIAWDAALLIARGPLADDVLSRARHGVIDRVYRNGELVAERHRYDNRLSMAVLTRLDRLAEGHGENAPVIRAVADEFDQFVGNLGGGNCAAEAFLAARFRAPDSKGEPVPVTEPPSIDGEIAPAGSEQALLARLGAYADFGAALPCEIDIEDLEPLEMESWTEEQIERAEFSGMLDCLTTHEWPESVREAGPDASDGMCKLRQLYGDRHPDLPAPLPEEPEDDFEGLGVFETDEGWMTDFPPPDGFDGYEEGEYGSADYRRALSAQEREVLQPDFDSFAAEEAEAAAAAFAARDRFFGFVPATPPAPTPAAEAAAGAAEEPADERTEETEEAPCPG